MNTNSHTSEQLVFPPVHLDKDDPRYLTWSVNVNLPTDIENEIAAYEKQDEYSVWTVIIHEALYAYRMQFWTKEQLQVEFEQDIMERIAGSKLEPSVEATPAFWKAFIKRSNRNVKEIKALQAKGELGNLLLPKELYAFILERMKAKTAATPTDVICKAMPFIRSARRRKVRHTGKTKRANKVKTS